MIFSFWNRMSHVKFSSSFSAACPQQRVGLSQRKSQQGGVVTQFFARCEWLIGHGHHHLVGR
jgi:hypothetical protein